MPQFIKILGVYHNLDYIKSIYPKEVKVRQSKPGTLFGLINVEYDEYIGPFPAYEVELHAYYHGYKCYRDRILVINKETNPTSYARIKRLLQERKFQY